MAWVVLGGCACVRAQVMFGQIEQALSSGLGAQLKASQDAAQAVRGASSEVRPASWEGGRVPDGAQMEPLSTWLTTAPRSARRETRHALHA